MRSVKRFPKRALRDLARGMGVCFASNRITVDGMPVGFMYREEPDDPTDSGWRFLAGDETQAYLDDPDNLGMLDVNTVANFDPDIVPYLRCEPGIALERCDDGEFAEVASPAEFAAHAWVATAENDNLN